MLVQTELDWSDLICSTAPQPMFSELAFARSASPRRGKPDWQLSTRMPRFTTKPQRTQPVADSSDQRARMPLLESRTTLSSSSFALAATTSPTKASKESKGGSTSLADQHGVSVMPSYIAPPLLPSLPGPKQPSPPREVVAGSDDELEEGELPSSPVASPAKPTDELASGSLSHSADSAAPKAMRNGPMSPVATVALNPASNQRKSNVALPYRSAPQPSPSTSKIPFSLTVAESVTPAEKKLSYSRQGKEPAPQTNGRGPAQTAGAALRASHGRRRSHSPTAYKPSSSRPAAPPKVQPISISLASFKAKGNKGRALTSPLKSAHDSSDLNSSTISDSAAELPTSPDTPRQRRSRWDAPSAGSPVLTNGKATVDALPPTAAAPDSPAIMPPPLPSDPLPAVPPPPRVSPTPGPDQRGNFTRPSKPSQPARASYRSDRRSPDVPSARGRSPDYYERGRTADHRGIGRSPEHYARGRSPEQYTRRPDPLPRRRRSPEPIAKRAEPPVRRRSPEPTVVKQRTPAQEAEFKKLHPFAARYHPDWETFKHVVTPDEDLLPVPASGWPGVERRKSYLAIYDPALDSDPVKKSKTLIFRHEGDGLERPIEDPRHRGVAEERTKSAKARGKMRLLDTLPIIIYEWDKQSVGAPPPGPVTSIVVQGYTRLTTSEALHRHFAQFGRIAELDFKHDTLTGGSLCLCWIKFVDEVDRRPDRRREDAEKRSRRHNQQDGHNAAVQAMRKSQGTRIGVPAQGEDGLISVDLDHSAIIVARRVKAEMLRRHPPPPPKVEKPAQTPASAPAVATALTDAVDTIEAARKGFGLPSKPVLDERAAAALRHSSLDDGQRTPALSVQDDIRRATRSQTARSRASSRDRDTEEEESDDEVFDRRARIRTQAANAGIARSGPRKSNDIDSLPEWLNAKLARNGMPYLTLLKRQFFGAERQNGSRLPSSKLMDMFQPHGALEVITLDNLFVVVFGDKLGAKSAHVALQGQAHMGIKLALDLHESADKSGRRESVAIRKTIWTDAELEREAKELLLRDLKTAFGQDLRARVASAKIAERLTEHRSKPAAPSIPSIVEPAASPTLEHSKEVTPSGLSGLVKIRKLPGFPRRQRDTPDTVEDRRLLGIDSPQSLREDGTSSSASRTDSPKATKRLVRRPESSDDEDMEEEDPAVSIVDVDAPKSARSAKRARGRLQIQHPEDAEEAAHGLPTPAPTDSTVSKQDAMQLDSDADSDANLPQAQTDARQKALTRPRSPTPDIYAAGLAGDDEDVWYLRMAIARVKNGEPLHSRNLEADLDEYDESPAVATGHEAGSAKAQGYYPIAPAQKSAYLPERNRAIVEVPEKGQAPASSTAISRLARANTRRLVLDMEQQRKSAATEAGSDLLKFNQLKSRKKQLKFARSPIHDWGLYAMEHIPARDMIIEYVGELIRQQVADKREKAYEKMGIGSSYLFRVDDDLVVDATKKGTYARLINHCCAPNCTARIITIGGHKKIVIYALTDIEPGDEITYDYHFATESDDLKIPCLCGSPNKAYPAPRLISSQDWSSPLRNAVTVDAMTGQSEAKKASSSPWKGLSNLFRLNAPTQASHRNSAAAPAQSSFVLKSMTSETELARQRQSHDATSRQHDSGIYTGARSSTPLPLPSMSSAQIAESRSPSSGESWMSRTAPTASSVFGVPLEESLRRASVAISMLGSDDKQFIYGYIPVVIAKCGLFLKENAIKTQGIFRVSGSNKRIRELEQIFDSPPRYGKDLTWDVYSVHDAASVFRRYLNMLPHPIIPFEMYPAFRDAIPPTGQPTEPKIIDGLSNLINSLPPPSHHLFYYVLDLLSVFDRNHEHTLMTASNLAVIFQPGLLRAAPTPVTDVKDTSATKAQMTADANEHRRSQQVLEFLIKHQSQFVQRLPQTGKRISAKRKDKRLTARSENTTASAAPSSIASRSSGPVPALPTDTDSDRPPSAVQADRPLRRHQSEKSQNGRRRRSHLDQIPNASRVKPLSVSQPSLAPAIPPISDDIPINSNGVQVKRSRTVPNSSARPRRRADKLEPQPFTLTAQPISTELFNNVKPSAGMARDSSGTTSAGAEGRKAWSPPWKRR
ncbi:uncharacterized protein L969DRAFT_92890 [Mixia osmundae IAM 14324]|uniref:Histone-lysine N-methyltransferase, H3 lysine-4 specific n=1 Tax=Mixia osmundae (strain CBS 9802 / IAM 14324 / JCM 22182 / KY 12970) TaxID=764103 RepID=G7DYV6_MIXOS|nr:uncharacterized protein L969DRAFT_92890 [Mixia osmundae IAM 14324]KEI41662.1 hypothetical protein L969DRAFT_92890 [Mixia osmundae IAM 14324]GAA95766.1 hypothetical protein E5Q_02423 [Mixia osmundae IAM 14324]